MLHILYENEDWLPPLVEALQARGLSFELHFVDGGVFDIQTAPAPGVYVNRMSPSAHTRGHGDGVLFMREYLPWLESHGRRVLNGSASFVQEVSKVQQHALLERAGIRTPRTIAVSGTARLKDAAREMALPFITKHNQGGKGLGVRLFRDLAAFDAYVDGSEFEPAFDGVTLLQQYVEPAQAFITRVEIVGGKFLYALQSSTASGFQLCPADACAIDDAFCPVGGSGRFGLSPLRADDPLVAAYIAFCAEHHIDAAGIEFVEDSKGDRYTYDVNMNTNYNGEVEEAAGVRGMAAWAELCEALVAEAG